MIAAYVRPRVFDAALVANQCTRGDRARQAIDGRNLCLSASLAQNGTELCRSIERSVGSRKNNSLQGGAQPQSFGDRRGKDQRHKR